MTETNTSSLEVILENVRIEAAHLDKLGVVAVTDKQEQGLIGLSSWLEGNAALPIKRHYFINEFLIFDDIEFVKNAYLGILQREPDELGLDNCVRQLREGGSKEEILEHLLNSEEGRSVGVTVDRLAEHFLGSEEEFPVKRRYHRSEFLFGDEDDFIKNAYLGILQRVPDESGLLDCQQYLAAGGLKEIVLVNLLNSAEAANTGVRVGGLAWYRLLRVVFRVPLFGRFFQAAYQRLNAVGNVLNVSKFDLLQEQNQAHRALTKNLIAGCVGKIESVVNDGLIQKKRTEVLFEALKIQHENLQRNVADVTADNKRLYEQAAETERRSQQLYRDMLLARNDLTYQRANLQQLIERLASGEDDSLKSEEVQSVVSDSAKDRFDGYYVAFEAECRGTLEEIHEAQRVYLPVLTAAEVVTEATPLLDIGCGRGEWLRLLSEQGFSARGVDINRVMIQQCRDQGYDAKMQNALDYLRAQPDQSLGAITGFHIIEHMPFEELYDVFAESLRVLVPNGLIIFETPNPENLLVATHTFYHDPTHKNPITPTGIEFLARYTGFSSTEIMRLHPYPQEAKIKGMDPLTERVNGHFCGPQDFAIVGRKPGLTAP